MPFSSQFLLFFSISHFRVCHTLNDKTLDHMKSNYQTFQHGIKASPIIEDCQPKIFRGTDWRINREDVRPAILYFWKKIVMLIVYVDNIIVTRYDCKEIKDLKIYLETEFEIKNLGTLKYFLGIKICSRR